MSYLGNVKASSTVHFKFSTHGADGAPIAPSSAFEAADISIYKDGSATQRNTAAGITMTSPFDLVTGLHHLAIDLSDNTDAGFYAAGSTYEVLLAPDETVDGVAVLKVIGRFTIDLAAAANVTQVLSATADPKPRTDNEGTVAGAPAPSTTSFDVTIGIDVASGAFTQAWVTVIYADGERVSRVCTTHTRISATVGRFAFSGTAAEADGAFPLAPAENDVVVIEGRGPA